MRRGFSVFIYLFSIAVLGAAVLVGPEDISRFFALKEMSTSGIVHIDALRLLLSLGALAMLLAALIWTFGQSYLFTKQIKDGYHSWASPVTGMDKKSRYWVWRWVFFLWVVLFFMVTTATAPSRDASILGSFLFEGTLAGAVQGLSLIAAGLLLIRQAWTDLRSGIAPLGVVGVLFGVFVLVSAGEAFGWGVSLVAEEGPKTARDTGVTGIAGIVDYGAIWVSQLPALVFFFYVGFWPAVGYLFPQVHFIMDRMALPIAPLSLFPVAVIGTLLDDHAIFDGLWNRSAGSVSEGRGLLLSLSLLFLVSFMRRYRGSVKDASASLPFQRSASKRLRR